MVFSSVIFLFYFLPIVLLGNFLLRNIQLKNLFLLVCSLLFYMWGEGELVVLVILSALFNYLIGLGLAYSRIPKAILIIGILLNIGLLGYYKYYEFIIENLNVLGFNIVHQNSIILPIGISFFTFHGLSYIIDVYRDKKLVQKNVSNLL